ncbi:MAG: hypothetical protein KBT27_05755 [Prevotellaceae bacterium]|nr:hypothetical protein [Candidatus Faecinaster equi]
MGIAALAISGISLLLSIISVIASLKSQHLQDKVNQLELELKQLELAEKEKEQQKNPYVEARIIHVTGAKYKIKIWNSGNAVAKNVSASWEKNSPILFFDQEKMPFELLEPQKGFELTVSTYGGSPRKLCITTTWQNEEGKEQSKEQWCDF